MSNFTLLALDVADATVARALTLSAVDNTTVLSTVNTDPSEAAEFTMKNGALMSAAASSLFIPAPGDLLEFGITDSPAMAYCNVYSTSAHGAQYPYTLGVNGNTSSLSICTSTSDVEVAVFEPTESTISFPGYGDPVTDVLGKERVAYMGSTTDTALGYRDVITLR
ncbi:hypothetical protein PENSPDRAFT_662060 [Peniophora sp. CONT]|nr:hypothetical protein PENSPDRAFT_662060 [Peniophora sp. CONT]